MNKVVLDTNVLVSAFWSNQGNPYRIVEMLFTGEIDLYCTDDIIEEYTEVLLREKLGLSRDKVFRLMTEIITNSTHIEVQKSSVDFADEDDRKFYDAAKASGATLVTGNMRHYPDEPFIITPAGFLERVESL